MIAASTQHIRVADPPTHAKPATNPKNIRDDTRHSPAPAKPATASPQKPAHSDARPETPAHTPASIPLVVKSGVYTLSPFSLQKTDAVKTSYIYVCN